MFGVHFAQNDIILQFGRRLGLITLEEDLALLEAALRYGGLLLLFDSLVQMLDESPRCAILLEEQRYLVEATTDESIVVNEGSTQQGVSIKQKHGLVSF